MKEIIAGKDGKVRVVRLKTASGELVRPVQRLIKLELDSPQDESELKSQIIDDKLQKDNTEHESQNDLVNNQEVESNLKSKVSQDKNQEDEVIVKTRSGRKVTNPDRLNY